MGSLPLILGQYYSFYFSNHLRFLKNHTRQRSKAQNLIISSQSTSSQTCSQWRISDNEQLTQIMWASGINIWFVRALSPWPVLEENLIVCNHVQTVCMFKCFCSFRFLKPRHLSLLFVTHVWQSVKSLCKSEIRKIGVEIPGSHWPRKAYTLERMTDIRHTVSILLWVLWQT